MSATAEGAYVDGSGQPATSDAALKSSSRDRKICFDCEECPPMFYCIDCKQFLCERCDTLVVHISKTTRNHKRMAMEAFLLMARAITSSTPTHEEMEADLDNKFCFVSPMNHRIYLHPRLVTLVPDPDVRPSLVGFIGPTGAGKSTLMRLLLLLDSERDEGTLPLAGAATDSTSTSADMHIYSGGEVHQIYGTRVPAYPLLFIDSEGRGGSKPHAVDHSWSNLRQHFTSKFSDKDYHEQRSRHVETSYPRMLYIFSDVLCFVFSGNWRERGSIMKPLLEWGRAAAIGAANQHRPQLFLIFNKVGEEAAEPRFDDFRKAYGNWMQDDQSRRDLEKYYTTPLVILIPHKSINELTVLNRVRMMKQEIHTSSMRIRTFREERNQLYSRRNLQLYMQLAADTFSTEPTAAFDIYSAITARSPSPDRLAECIYEFRRGVNQSNVPLIDRFERHRISLVILRKRFRHAVLLYLGRQNANLQFGPNAELPAPLRSSLEKAQILIDNELPCAARDGLYDCGTIQRCHDSQHATAQAKAYRWDGNFSPHSEVKRESDACKLVHIAERALQRTSTLDVKRIRTELLRKCRSQRDKHPWLEQSSIYQVCVVCLVEFPTEMLSCHHIICVICAKAGAEMYSHEMSSNLECPVCFSSVNWYPKDLPLFAGYRMLSLDGGGIRGIVELLSLSKIMTFFGDMPVTDLFDVVVGTSTGGIIALALTVHARNEKRNSLEEVITMFEEFSGKVFAKDMLYAGAKYDWIRYTCHFFGFYDTKYKNKNLLEILKQQIGVQPLLRSCVGGPHVIVSSCDRDQNYSAGWFTSYNRQNLNNESGILSKKASQMETDQSKGKVSGRVLDNHLFTAQDVAAATSAALPYLPSYPAINRFWVDGGFRFNCPASIGLQEARILYPNHQASALISLGCGNLKRKSGTKSDKLIGNIKEILNAATDAEGQSQDAIRQLNERQPDSAPCSLRLNPTIDVSKGATYELDSAKDLPALKKATMSYLSENISQVHEAANLLFAALFYLDVEMNCNYREPKLDRCHIRSRAPLPLFLRGAFIAANKTSRPPFSVTGQNGSTRESKFFWDLCSWDQGVMNLPCSLVGISAVVPLTVVVKLRMCLPGTVVPEEWSLPISGMPCTIDFVDSEQC